MAKYYIPCCNSMNQFSFHTAHFAVYITALLHLFVEIQRNWYIMLQLNGLVQERRKSSANAR